MSAKLAKRLVEPDYWTCPHGARVRPEPFMTYGPEVADFNARADFAPDPQQELALDLIFAIRPDGSPDSFAGCVICCRQNLKTGLFKQAALGWIFVTEEPTVVWSAHEMITTTDAQRDLENLITAKPFMSRRLAPGITNGIFYGSLGQRIEFASGQQILFKARTNTGGRGLARRKLILDEAFALTKGMMGAILPIMLAQENAQVLYGSSAGKADSEVLLDVRDRGRNGKSPRLWYLEWLAPREPCADPECLHPKDAPALGVDCALDREHLLRKANPALETGRLTLERLADLRQEMPPEEYARECLGWWDEDAAGLAAINFASWSRLADPEAARGARPVFGVAVAPDRSWAAVAAAWRRPDGHLQVVMTEGGYRPDATWLQAHIDALRSRAPGADVWVDAAARGVLADVEEPSQAEQAQADNALADAVLAGTIRHGNDPALDMSVKVSRWRTSGDTRVLDRKGAKDISPLRAASLAAWGVVQDAGSVYEERDMRFLG